MREETGWRKEQTERQRGIDFRGMEREEQRDIKRGTEECRENREREIHTVEPLFNGTPL